VRRFQTPLPITRERATARSLSEWPLFSPWLSLMHFPKCSGGTRTVPDRQPPCDSVPSGGYRTDRVRFAGY